MKLTTADSLSDVLKSVLEKIVQERLGPILDEDRKRTNEFLEAQKRETIARLEKCRGEISVEFNQAVVALLHEAKLNGIEIRLKI